MISGIIFYLVGVLLAYLLSGVISVIDGDDELLPDYICWCSWLSILIIVFLGIIILISKLHNKIPRSSDVIRWAINKFKKKK